MRGAEGSVRCNKETERWSKDISLICNISSSQLIKKSLFRSFVGNINSYAEHRCISLWWSFSCCSALLFIQAVLSVFDFILMNAKRCGMDWALNCGTYFYSAKKDTWHINLFVNIQQATTHALLITLCWIVMMKEKQAEDERVPQGPDYNGWLR